MVVSRSAVLRSADEPYAVEAVTLDDPGPGEALVRVVATGMCHTDDFGRSGLLGETFLPAVLGHEGAGVVEAAGPGAGVSPGDHVVLTFDSCGTCRACLEGIPTCCAAFELHNLTGTRPDGTGAARDAAGAPLTSRWFGQSSFGEYAIATARNLVPVDVDLPLDLLGPLGCGVQTGAGTVLNVLRPGPGTSIAIFGTGAVGLSAVMAAKLAGADEIVAVDINPDRRALALELGATRAAGSAAAAGSGFDLSFDTTGVAAVMTAAIEVLRRPGHAVLAGAGLDMLTLHPASLAGKTVSYVYEGGGLPRTFVPRLTELWRAGRFPFDRLVTRYPLSEINTAEADVRAGKTVKAVLVMPGAGQ